MGFSTAKLSELPLRSTISLPLTSCSHSSSFNLNLNLLFFSSPKPSFSHLKPFSSSLRTTQPKNPSKTPNPNPNSHKSAPWLNKWPSPPKPLDRKVEIVDDKVESRFFDRDSGRSAMDRIVLRLRNLGLGSDDEDEEEEEEVFDNAESRVVSGEEKLGDLLKRDWIRPDMMLVEEKEGEDKNVLPWERSDEEIENEEEGGGKRKRRTVKAPTLAELTLEDEELRRLRREGMTLRERINVAKAGVTQAVLEKIHEKWRKSELVRLKFHESLAHDMKTAHQIVERRTGGLVIWRSGSVMVVFRGNNYEGPSSSMKVADKEGDNIFVPDVSSAENQTRNDDASNSEESKVVVLNPSPVESMTEEESEYNSLLDGLGPRFLDWWGTGVLPVDADLLPQKIPGYKPPFRLLPTGMRSRLTNAEMTNLRKVAKSLPCHFALGRNRNHQGLAAAIIKLWEKSLVVKIAVKRGIQNTNNKLMAEELKSLTGGVLLLRNKFYIVMYRGKDFLPTSVATALAERQEQAKQVQNVEEKARSSTAETAKQCEAEDYVPAGTLAEFYEAQARWGREISVEERERMIREDSRAKSARVVKRIEHKLEIAEKKKQRAEKLLSKIEASMVPTAPSDDLEMITDEERFVFCRIGLKMKAYLPLGIRGVFDGVIENMHLHWKHRELVKLISKQKTLAFVEETARLLEYESGGILVAIERVPKGFALIYYRGKNYRRPISLRPRNLLTKAKALKRSVAMQRHEALSQHISELECNIEQMKEEMGIPEDALEEESYASDDHGWGENSEAKGEVSFLDSHAEGDLDWEDDEGSESELTSSEMHDVPMGK
ncbi:RNA-binding, CRM domain [Dillenia turbinata]|uniref:RNA-binding, CRM domain n=1 Tax=Dillenia turbinata TaxID=194707 RepID=A0AAN8V563_9MAGN